MAEEALRRINKPASHTAYRLNQVWSWDIAFLASTVRGQFYYLYLFEDIISRKIVGYEVHERECGELAAELVQRCMLTEQCLHRPWYFNQTMKEKLEELGVLPSNSRPRISNDNPCSEALLRTLKYRPEWLSSGFARLSEARDWLENFTHWYNNKHRHSKFNFVTPAQRHAGQDQEVLEKRKVVLKAVKEMNPNRWLREVRNCKPIGAVTLNPAEEKQLQLEAAA